MTPGGKRTEWGLGTRLVRSPQSPIFTFQSSTLNLLILATAFAGNAPGVDYAALEPNAIVWANPCEGKKLRVLFVSTDGAIGEAGSVARRLDMDYEVATVACAWDYGRTAERDQLNLKLLEKDYDVCVLGSRTHFGCFPEEIRYRLLKKTTEGMGVVTIWFWHYPLPEKIVPQNKGVKGPELFKGVPFGAFENLVEDKTNPPDRLDELGRFVPAGLKRERVAKWLADGTIATEVGKTRLVRIPLNEGGWWVRPTFVSGGTLTPDMYVYDEYYLSLLCKAMLWAAHRTAAATIESITPQGETLKLVDGPKVVAADISVAAPIKCDVTYAIRDSFNRVVHSGKLPFSLTAGKKQLGVPVPPLGAGSYFADVWLKRNGKTLDWGSAFFRLEGTGRIEAVNLARQSHNRGEPIEGTVIVKDAPPGAELHLSITDSWGRVIAGTSVPVQAESVAFSLPVDGAVGGIGFRLLAELVSNRETQARAHWDFPIRKPAPDFLFGLCMGEDNSCFHLARLRRRLVRPYRSDGDNYNYGLSAFHSSIIAWDNLESNAFPFRVTGIPSPEDLRKWPETIKQVAKLAPYGLRFVNLGDDCGPASEFGDKFADDFRSYVKGLYGTLDALNKEWGTALKDWKEIDQKLVNSEKEKKNFPPVADSYRYCEERYCDAIRLVREAAQSVYPDVAVGQYASSWGSGTGEFLEAANYFAPYWNDTECEIVGSFYGKMKGYYGANGGYFGDTGTPTPRQFEPWYPLLSGCNLVHNWYTCANVGGDFTLNPLKIRIWLENAAEIKSGIDMQLIRSNRIADPVAILHSRSSGYASALESRIAEIGNSRSSFNAILHDLGLQYRYISSKHLVDGMLAREGVKVLVLPYCQAMSVREADVIRRFVQEGGTVVADVRPAVWDEHCRQLENGLLDDVFGISRKQAAEYVVFGELKLKEDFAGLKAGQVLGSATADSSVSATTATAYGELGGAPAVLVNSFGKGRAVLLNTFIGRYRLMQADGASRELSQLYAALFAQAGVAVHKVKALVAGKDAIGLRRVLFQNGSALILGACKRGLLCERYPVQVAFEIPESRHVYDMRGGRYLGYGKTFRDKFDAEQVKFYALMPDKVEGVKVSVPKKAKRGRTMEGVIAVKDKSTGQGEGRMRPPRALFVQVTGPDRKACEWFEQKLWAPGGEAALHLPIAANETPGTYEVYARDVLTGLVGRAAFLVED